MTFLNASLLFGLAAAAVPVVLHLLSRREPRRVVFPAVRFLTRRFETNRSRLRIRRWWLLALRVLALLAAVLALAHPVVHRDVSLSWFTAGLILLFGVGLLAMASVAACRDDRPPWLTRGLFAAAVAALVGGLGWAGYTLASGPPPPGERAAPMALAIVVDNGPTSSWSGPDDERIERTREVAAWVISRVPPASRVAVLDRSSVPAAFSLDVAGAVSKLDAIRPSQVPTAIGSRIDAAVRLLRTSELENRQVLVLTDLAATTWDESARGVDLSASLAASPEVAVTLFDTGPFEGTNRSLSMPRIADATPPQGVATSIVATASVSASDTVDERSLTAELSLYENTPGFPLIRDGRIERPPLRRVDRTSVRVRRGGSAEVVVTMPPLEIGTHHAVIRLAGEDPLTLDDERYFTLRVLSPSALLVVGDRPADAQVLGAAIAAPFEAGDPQAEFAVERIGYTDLPAVTLDGFAAVLMLDPPASALRDPTLEDFVRGGGRLWVALGPALADGEPLEPWLPRPLRRWRPLDPGTFLEMWRPDHPLLRPLADQSEPARWSDFRVYQYWQLETSGSDQLIAGYAGTDHPAIISRVVGDGVVLIMTSPLPALAAETRGWNEWFSASEPWPAFVLVRQIAEQLTGRADQSTETAVGRPYLVDLESVEAAGDGQLAAAPAADSPAAPRSPAAPGSPVAPGSIAAPGSRTGSSPGRSGTSGEDGPIAAGWVDGGQGGAAQVADTDPAGGADSTGGATPSGQATPEARRVQLFRPGDRSPIPLPLEASERPQALVGEIPRAGTYWIRGRGLRGGFSANLSPEATSLERLDPSRLDPWFGPEQYTLVDTREAIELASEAGTPTVSLRSPAILLALGAFLLEAILGNRFYRTTAGQTGAGPTTVGQAAGRAAA